MSSYYLEQVREDFASLELIEKSIVSCLFQKVDKPKESVLLEHKISRLLEMSQAKGLDCQFHLQDPDGQKREEVEVISGQRPHSALPDKQPDLWLNFYDRLKDIKDYYKRYPGTKVSGDKSDPALLCESLFQPP